jgi:hypothetical protein
MTNPLAYAALVFVLQLVFTSAVIVLVGRRFPQRLRVYRWLVPAAVPVMFYALVAYRFVSTYLAYLDMTGQSFRTAMLAPLGRFSIGYGVVYLFGLLLATGLVRLFRR